MKKLFFLYPAIFLGLIVILGIGTDIPALLRHIFSPRDDRRRPVADIATECDLGDDQAGGPGQVLTDIRKLTGENKSVWIRVLHHH
jgi:hypothetical protein